MYRFWRTVLFTSDDRTLWMSNKFYLEYWTCEGTILYLWVMTKNPLSGFELGATEYKSEAWQLLHFIRSIQAICKYH